MTLSLTCHSCKDVLSAETEDELVALGPGARRRTWPQSAASERTRPGSHPPPQP